MKKCICYIEYTLLNRLLLKLGELQVGDQILKLNGSIINDSTHFFHLLRSAPPCATLLIARDEARVAELKAQVHIPPERAKYITRRDGYTYIVSDISNAF